MPCTSLHCFAVLMLPENLSFTFRAGDKPGNSSSSWGEERDYSFQTIHKFQVFKINSSDYLKFRWFLINHLLVHISVFILTSTFSFLFSFPTFFLPCVALFQLTGTFLHLPEKIIAVHVIWSRYNRCHIPLLLLFCRHLLHSCCTKLQPSFPTCVKLGCSCNAEDINQTLHRTWLLLTGLSLGTGFFGGWEAMLAQEVATRSPISNKQIQLKNNNIYFWICTL